MAVSGSREIIIHDPRGKHPNQRIERLVISVPESGDVKPLPNKDGAHSRKAPVGVASGCQRGTGDFKDRTLES